MIKRLYIKYKEIINYIIFGVLTTVVSIGTYELFNALLGRNLYLLNNVISWVFAVAFAYITNKLWVFESKSFRAGVVFKELVGFFGTRLFSLGVEEAGLWFLMDLCKMNGLNVGIFGFDINGSMIAKIIMQFVVVVLNYVFSKFIVFARKKK